MHLKLSFATLLACFFVVLFNIHNTVNALPLSSAKGEHSPRMVTLPLRRVSLSRGIDIHPQIVSELLE